MITSKRFLLKIYLKEFTNFKDINIIPEEKKKISYCKNAMGLRWYLPLVRTQNASCLNLSCLYTHLILNAILLLTHRTKS